MATIRQYCLIVAISVVSTIHVRCCLVINTKLMQAWFDIIGSSCELPTSAMQSLRDFGFVVIPGPLAAERLAQLTVAYDSAVVAANGDDIKIGSTTTRIRDFVNRG